MSKVENSVDDARKLAQRCKALEAQLRQTITKKEHHEIVLEFEEKITAMEKTVSSQDRKIADQEKELARTSADQQRNANLGKLIADVGVQVAALAKTAEAQGRTVDSIFFKISQGTIPANVHQQSLSRVKELEEQVAGMVSRTEYSSLQRRFEDAARRLGSMVPSSDYEALKGRVQELESAISSMVPREQLESSEATVREFRARLAERVPQSTYDELVSKVVQLAEEVTGGGSAVEEEGPVMQPEPAEPEHPTPAEPKPVVQPVVPITTTPVQEGPKIEADPSPLSPAAPSRVEGASEITEVGSQLAELNTAAIEAKPPGVSQAEEPPAQKAPEGKAGKPEPALVVTAATPEDEGQSPQS